MDVLRNQNQNEGYPKNDKYSFTRDSGKDKVFFTLPSHRVGKERSPQGKKNGFLRSEVKDF